jgi:hypothetical protein
VNDTNAKRQLMDKWLAAAKQAERDIQIAKGNEYHAAVANLAIYSEAARILASSDGTDHVLAALRAELSKTNSDRAVRVWASLITDLETATA